MSAPVNEENSQDPHLYAPPWARMQAAGRKPRSTNSPPAAARIGDSKMNWRPPSKNARFEGDAGMSDLRHRLSLDPDVVPQPPARSQGGPVGRSTLVKISLCVGLLAIVTYTVVEINLRYINRSIPPNDASITKTARLIATPVEMQSMAGTRLVVENRQTFTDEPLPLGVVLAGATGGGSVFLNALVKGARLSAGEWLGPAGWNAPMREPGPVLAYAYHAFVSPMDAGIEFPSATNPLLDIQIGRLEWIMKSLELGSITEKQFDQSDTMPPGSTATLASDQVSRLIKRGLDFLKDGDIAASRLMLRRAADARNAQAALLLGDTFDPIVLAKLGVFGPTGDRTAARAWYRKAMEFGSLEASRRIERLAQTNR